MKRRDQIIRRHGIDFVYRPWIFRNVAASRCGKVLDLWNIGICNRPVVHFNDYRTPTGLRDNNNKITPMAEHRIIAKMFVENSNPSEHTVVNHLNGIRTDNRPENLEWTTNILNLRYRAFSSVDEKFRVMMSWSFYHEPLAYINTRIAQIREDVGKDGYVVSYRRYIDQLKCPARTFLPYFDDEDMDAYLRMNIILERGLRW